MSSDIFVSHILFLAQLMKIPALQCQAKNVYLYLICTFFLPSTSTPSGSLLDSILNMHLAPNQLSSVTAYRDPTPPHLSLTHSIVSILFTGVPASDLDHMESIYKTSNRVILLKVSPIFPHFNPSNISLLTQNKKYKTLAWPSKTHICCISAPIRTQSHISVKSHLPL